jgi:hypothetical protein
MLNAAQLRVSTGSAAVFAGFLMMRLFTRVQPFTFSTVQVAPDRILNFERDSPSLTAGYDER